MVRFCAALVAAAAYAVTLSPAGAASCRLHVGTAVMLRSSDFDPDVLVWDSRRRAIDYAAGNIKDAAVVIRHTLLSRAGTRAIVVMCDPRSSRRAYSATVNDTIGIRITSGPHRGRYGWVVGDDAHGRYRHLHRARRPRRSHW